MKKSLLIISLLTLFFMSVKDFPGFIVYRVYGV